MTTHTHCKCSQHNQKRNALQIIFIWLRCEHLQCVSLFVCVVSICTICCQTNENVFLICWCFFYLHVFSEVAARWALSATLWFTPMVDSFRNKTKDCLYECLTGSLAHSIRSKTWTNSVMCTLWTHTRSSGHPFMLRCPGSSWGFGALLKGTSVVVLKVERVL